MPNKKIMKRFWEDKMTKIYSIKCNKYRKFKNHKILCIFDLTLVLSIICDKYGSKDERLFKEKKAMGILKIIGLINDIEEYQLNT